MPYVPVPKDLTKVKTKLAFNLTKRQLICFSLAGLVGLPVYFFTRGEMCIRDSCMGWERKKPPYNWQMTSGFPMRTGSRRERQKSPSPGRNPRRNSFRKQKTAASVFLPIISTYSCLLYTSPLVCHTQPVQQVVGADFLFQSARRVRRPPLLQLHSKAPLRFLPL